MNVTKILNEGRYKIYTPEEQKKARNEKQNARNASLTPEQLKARKDRDNARYKAKRDKRIESGEVIAKPSEGFGSGRQFEKNFNTIFSNSVKKIENKSEIKIGGEHIQTAFKKIEEVEEIEIEEIKKVKFNFFKYDFVSTEGSILKENGKIFSGGKGDGYNLKNASGPKQFFELKSFKDEAGEFKATGFLVAGAISKEKAEKEFSDKDRVEKYNKLIKVVANEVKRRIGENLIKSISQKDRKLIKDWWIIKGKETDSKGSDISFYKVMDKQINFDVKVRVSSRGSKGLKAITAKVYQKENTEPSRETIKVVFDITIIPKVKNVFKSSKGNVIKHDFSKSKKKNVKLAADVNLQNFTREILNG